MNDIVFLEPNKIDAIPFTTSDVVAEKAEIKHHAVQQMIAKHESTLSAFGRVAFEMRACPHRTGSSTEKIYHLNEEQATLLITFLRNTDPVIKFKIDLVREFYRMRTELTTRKVYREQLKPVRRELTDVVKETTENKWAYKQYTDLAYKTVTGKIAVQLRAERQAPQHAAAVDYMTSDEIAHITKIQSQIATLLETGMDYQQIKALLLNRKMVGNIA